MSRYEVEEDVEYSDDGSIAQAGTLWAETRPGTDALLTAISAMALLAVIAGLIWLFGNGTLNPLLGYGAPVLMLSFWLLTRLPGQVRSVYFGADGSITTPHGLHHRPSQRKIEGDHRHIVSIEARIQRDQQQGTQLYEVMMLSRGGDLICISRNLQERIALKAAAQMTHMLEVVRREQSGSLAA